MMSVKAQTLIPNKDFVFSLPMNGQFVMVGNVYSIDLDRFVSASMSPSHKPDDHMIVIRLKGSGFLRFFKYSYYRINYKNSQDAIKDLKLIIDSANRWQNSKPK